MGLCKEQRRKPCEGCGCKGEDKWCRDCRAKGLNRKKATCKRCGIVFLPASYCHPSYCSSQCRSRRITKKCKGCGGGFKAAPSDIRLYCSKDCHPPIKGVMVAVNCEICGTFVRKLQYKQKVRTCSLDCQREWALRVNWHDNTNLVKRKEKQAAKRLRTISKLERQVQSLIDGVDKLLLLGTECVHCGTELSRHRHRFCSVQCNNRHKKRRRRAQKAGARASRNISTGRVYARDKWKCWICKSKVIETKDNTNPLQATLDHVIPLSKGGEHVESNLACCCRKCNVKKRANVITLF